MGEDRDRRRKKQDERSRYQNYKKSDKRERGTHQQVILYIIDRVRID